MADIPGLIEGAHMGVGLGTRFLGHVERCGVLLHLIDATHENVMESYKTVRHEISSYGADLDAKEELIGLNKCDMLSQEEIMEKMLQISEETGQKVIPLSGKTGKGRDILLKAILEKLRKKET